MDWHNGWQVFFLVSNLLSDASSLAYFGKEFWQWRKLERKGVVTSFKIHRPLALLLLISIGTGICCIWIAFHRGAKEAAKTTPSYSQHVTPSVASQIAAPSLPATETVKAKDNEHKSRLDPCPNGYTVLEDATASKSKWNTAKTTGFYINGSDPCIKLKRTKSIDNDTGYKFSKDQEKPAAPSYEQKCDNGSACAQGQGSTAIVNNGAPKLVMSDEQQASIRDEMKPFVGYKFSVWQEVPVTEDSETFANKLTAALTEAGLIFDGSNSGRGQSFGPGPTYPGVSLEIGNSRMQLATAFVMAMKNAGLLHGKMPAERALQDEKFEIRIAANR